jgi:3-hydroxy acid dehydrogenase/malonic semialdehyde reductase
LEGLANEYPGRVLPITVDVQDKLAVQDLATALPAGFAQVDVVINNAGLALGMEGATQASLDDWDRMIDTNCRGLAYITRAFLPGMVERRRGHIVNLGSTAGSYPHPGGNVYGATKAFVHQFSLNLRSDLHGTGVRVTCIEPGMCGGTEFSQVRFAGDKERVERLYAGAKPLTSDDIAGTIEWTIALPAHVNVNTIELMPVGQSFGALAVHRTR